MKFEEILNDLLNLPKTLQRCLNYYISPEGKNRLENIRDLVGSANFGDCTCVMFIGHSYNHFASMIPFRYINSRYDAHSPNMNKVCVSCEIDEFLTQYNSCQLNNGTIFIFTSFSGESVQIKEGIDKVIEAGIKRDRIWCITNNEDSYLASKSHLVFPLKVDHEEVIGTKSYVNTILVQYLMARSIINKPAIPRNREDEVRDLIFEMKFYGQDWDAHTKNLTDFLGEDFNFLYFISKGASMSTAYQAALNCKAYTRTFGEGISIGLFLHGPFQIVDSNFRCVLIAGDETSIDDTLKLMDLITQKLGSGKVILINNSRKLSSRGRANKNVYVFEHTTNNSYLAPIFEIMVLQYLFLLQARKKGVIE